MLRSRQQVRAVQSRSPCSAVRGRVQLRVTAAKHGPHDHETQHASKAQDTHGALANTADLSKLRWSPATVIRNDALNLDGTTRLVHLSITDDVEVAYGRKSQTVVESQRWMDSYTMPGQQVAVKLPDGGLSPHLYSIASTPYESRRDSSTLNASLIEVVADRGQGAGDEVALADLGPGAELQVSQVVGRGFCSLLSSVNALQLALEEGRPLLCIAVGTRGMVPVRALLSWTPVLAHATASKVSCLYAAKSATSAVFLPEWDGWREAGIQFQPIYTESWDVDAAAAKTAGSQNHGQVIELLDKAMFLRDGGFNSLAKDTSSVIVVLAGLSGDVGVAVSKRLTAKGVEHDRILWADY